MDLSLNKLAYLYASKMNGDSERIAANHFEVNAAILTKLGRSAYNFKATLFNLATAALVTSVVIAILNPLSSLTLFAVGLSGLVRHAILKNLKEQESSERLRKSDDRCSVLFEFIFYIKLAPSTAFSYEGNRRPGYQY